ncbi:MAG: anaerobic sulfatase maturase [Spirochaetales bacterium]|nr:anaerobic sulfatase maturase [Spirochaetales bacterium]
MKPFSLLIKPASADCNLRCKYCFYLDHLSENPTRMDDETLERVVASYFSTGQSHYSLIFQGGEPLLMGLPFYKKLIGLEKNYAPPGALVTNIVQTNGTLITEEMAAFLGEYNFLVGVSMDGPPEIHDAYRKSVGGQPSHHLVERGINLLRKHRVEYNVLVLVNDLVAARPRKVFNYLTERGERFLQFIPCVEFEADGVTPLSYSVDPLAWGDFLIQIFDLWYPRRYEVSLRLIDSLLSILMGRPPTLCQMDQNCCQYFVVEYNGDVYPCDFYVREDLKLGNVAHHSWGDFLSSPVYREFGTKKQNYSRDCLACPWLNFCYGDCQKNRPGLNNEGKSYLCPGLKRFYEYAIPKLRPLAHELKMS